MSKKVFFLCFISSCVMFCSCSPYIQFASDQNSSSGFSHHRKKPYPNAYDEPPVLIKHVVPEYSQEAKSKLLQGQVILEVKITEFGTVDSVNVRKSLQKGPGGLDEAAVKAVRQWIYEPAKFNGGRVETWITFPIEFSLRK